MELDDPEIVLGQKRPIEELSQLFPLGVGVSGLAQSELPATLTDISNYKQQLRDCNNRRNILSNQVQQLNKEIGLLQEELEKRPGPDIIGQLAKAKKEKDECNNKLKAVQAEIEQINQILNDAVNKYQQLQKDGVGITQAINRLFQIIMTEGAPGYQYYQDLREPPYWRETVYNGIIEPYVYNSSLLTAITFVPRQGVMYSTFKDFAEGSAKKYFDEYLAAKQSVNNRLEIITETSRYFTNIQLNIEEQKLVRNVLLQIYDSLESAANFLDQQINSNDLVLVSQVENPETEQVTRWEAVDRFFINQYKSSILAVSFVFQKVGENFRGEQLRTQVAIGIPRDSIDDVILTAGKANFMINLSKELSENERNLLAQNFSFTINDMNLWAGNLNINLRQLFCESVLLYFQAVYLNRFFKEGRIQQWENCAKDDTVYEIMLQTLEALPRPSGDPSLSWEEVEPQQVPIQLEQEQEQEQQQQQQQVGQPPLEQFQFTSVPTLSSIPQTEEQPGSSVAISGKKRKEPEPETAPEEDVELEPKKFKPELEPTPELKVIMEEASTGN